MKHFLLTFFATLLTLSSVIDAKADNVIYQNDFSSATSTDGFTFLTNSTYSWKRYSKSSNYCLQYWGKASPADTWAITPDIQLKEGGLYELKVNVCVQGSYTKPLSIYIGYGNTAEAQLAGQMIMDKIFSNNNYQTETMTFTAPSSGAANIGFRVYGNITDANDIYVDDIVLTEIKVVPAAVSNLIATPAANGGQNVTLSWSNPDKLNNGSPLSSISKIQILRNNKEIASLDSNLAPGSENSYTDDFSDLDSFVPGSYTYSVIVYNGEDAGEPATVQSPWTGADVPAHITNLTATLDESDSKTVLINFTEPTGENGGFVDKNSIYYKIERSSKNETTVLQQNWQGELPYRDAITTGLNYYTYSVTNVDSSGSELSTKDNKQSVSIIAGGELELPYENTFDSADDISIFNNFSNISAAGQKYEVSSGSLQANKYGYSAIDAWLVSPVLKLESGKTYNVSFQSWKSSSSVPTTINFYIAKGSDVETLKGNKILTASPTGTSVNNALLTENTFTVPESGAYYFALQVEGSSSYGQNRTYIDNLLLEWLPVTPLAPAEFTVKADENGANKAKLTWVNPTMGNNGENLITIDKIEVYRNDKTEALASLTGDNYNSPGATCTWEDSDIPSAGVYTYTLKPYLENNTRDYAEATSDWIGSDELTTVSNVWASMSASDPLSIELTFDSKGKNGGFVDLTDVTYKISRRTKSNSTETVLTENFKYDNMPFVDSSLPGLDAYIYKVVVMDLNNDKGSDSNTIIGGGTVELPYINDFSSSNVGLLITGHAEGGTKDWLTNSGNLGFTRSGTTATEHDAWVIFPPMDLKENANYSLSFKSWYSSTYATAKPLKAYIVNSTNPAEWNEAIFDEAIPSNATSSSPKLVNVEYTSPANAISYLVIRLQASITDTYYLYVDDLKFERTDRAPLAVENLAVTAGDKGAMTATVTWTNPTLDNKNDELQKIDKVDILRNGRVVGTVDKNEVGGEGSFEDAIEGEPGLYSYTAVAYLNDVEGVKAEAVSAWIGPDELTAPENVEARVNYEGYPEITFDAVTVGKNGGFVDVENIVYTIYRDNDKIAENLKTNSYADKDELTSGSTYTYGVTASLNGKESDKITVTLKYVAPVELPFNQDFSNEENFATWEFLADSGSSKWAWQAKTNKETKPNLRAGTTGIWAITTPFKAQTGTISASYQLVGYQDNYNEAVDVYLLTNPNNRTEKKLIRSVKVLEALASDDNQYKDDIVIEEGGTYYLGFYVTANRMYSYLLSCDIEQLSVANPETPANPTSINVDLQSDGSRQITFDAVTTNTAGEPLEDITYTLYLDDQELVSGLKENTYLDKSNVELGKHIYGVKAVNGEYESTVINSDVIVFGEALELPYNPDFSSADDFEFWSSANGAWKYESHYNAQQPHSCINISKENGMAITPPFKASKGKIELTYKLNSYSARYSSDAKIYLIKNINDLENADVLVSKTIEYSSWPQAETIEIPIAETGTYYIGYQMIGSSSWYLFIEQSDIEQTEVEIAPLPMDYSTDFSDDSEAWTVSGNDDDATWKFVEDTDPYFFTQHENVMLVSPAILMDKQYGEVTINIAGGHEDPEQIHMFLLRDESEDNGEKTEVRLKVVSELNASKIKDFEVSGNEITEASWEFKVPSTDVYYLGFTATPQEGSEGVRLHSFALEGKVSTDVSKLYTDGGLIYLKSSETILIPSAGRLEVYSTNGMRMIGLDTDESVNISSLANGTYIARFVGTDGNVATLKFVK